MTLNIIKLIVGTDSMEQFAAWQDSQTIPYEGGSAVPCYTRFMPKRADEILKSGGSLYRVMKSRVVCRQRIVGFESIETDQGKKCMIMQDPEIVTVVNMAYRPFQGWRYFEAAKAPADRGVYVPGDVQNAPPEEMAEELRAAGLL